MGEIVNLRRARKAKSRADAEQKAAENRTRFGRSKAERESAKANTALDTRRLDAHQRRSSEEPEDRSE
jgi:hypothetical protein